MRVILVMLLAASAGCGKKSTCEKAVDRMMECKTIVGGLLPRPPAWVTKTEEGQLKGTLRGACDAAVESDAAQEKRMKCVAEADNCDALAACE